MVTERKYSSTAVAMFRTISHLLALVAVAQGSVESTFKTICSVPNTTTHYVSSPDTRGTLDILWSSLFTIIACTLTVQHLNVPKQREGRDPGWRGDLKWATKDTLRSLKWMLVTVLAPEVVIAKDWADLVAAKQIFPKLRHQAIEDGVPWTMTHTLFANMGGFVIRYNQQDILSEQESAGEGQGPVGEGTATEPRLVQTTPQDNGLATNTNSIPKIAMTNSLSTPVSKVSLSSTPNPYHLLAINILDLREAGQIPRLPYITQDELNDKSKANPFIKIIAVTQISWMVVQILVRTGRRLSVTQLEIGVLAFSVCAIIMYLLNWQMPKDVKIPYTLLSLPRDLPAETTRVLMIRNQSSTTYPGKFLAGSIGLHGHRRAINCGAAVPNDYFEDSTNDYSHLNADTVAIMGLILGCVTFGGIHVAAWNFRFPTEIELIIWRGASIWCTVFAPFVVFAISVATAMLKRFFGKEGNGVDFLMNKMLVLFTSLYIIGRLILLVEIFRTLFFLPPDAFVATSASNIPHVS